MSTTSHKADAPRQIRAGIITVSTTRSLAEDKSGKWMSKRLVKEGHTVVFHVLVPDNAEEIRATVLQSIEEHKPQAILLTGGTGISRQDVTIETVRPMLQKEMTAFGVLFAQLSFEQVDSAAMLSRATAGIIGDTALFCMPGSLKACKLACKALILPELGHIVRHMTVG